MCVFVMLETEIFWFFKFSYSNMAVSGHMKLVKCGYLVNQGFTKPAAK